MSLFYRGENQGPERLSSSQRVPEAVRLAQGCAGSPLPTVLQLLFITLRLRLSHAGDLGSKNSSDLPIVT